MLFSTKSRLPGLLSDPLMKRMKYFTGFQLDINGSSISEAFNRDLEVFCFTWMPINLSPTEIRLPPSGGNKLWRSGRVWGVEVTCQSATFITGTKRSRFFLLTARNLSAKHIQEMHLLYIFIKSIDLFASRVRTSRQKEVREGRYYISDLIILFK